MLFSKVGTIFTIWGSMLRFLSFSFLVSVLVVFLTCEKPPGYSEVDKIITVILLAGAIFLEIAGVVVQLVSDWALVWAWKNQSKWATAASVLFLHEFLMSKRQSWFLNFHQKKGQRWSEVMGQFSFRVFCTKYKPTMCNKMWSLLGREKMLKRFSSQESPVQHLKDLIIGHLTHLHEKSEKAAVVDTLQSSTERVADLDTSQTSTQNVANVDTFQTSTEKIAEEDTVRKTAIEEVADVDRLPTLGVGRGEWTLVRYDLLQQFKFSIELEFGQRIVIWHVATEVCYELDHSKILGKDKEKLQAAKMLSDYMMYLLVACLSRFPFCEEYDTIMEDYANMKELFDGGAFELSKPNKVENEGDTTNMTLVKKAQRLVLVLKGNPKRWDIMGSMWVEMLCYAAWKCPWNNHIQGIQNGGEFLTHVWLLLMHFGVARRLETSNSSLKDENGGWVKDSSEKIDKLFEEVDPTKGTQNWGECCFS